MTPDISERAFEAAIECALLRHGPDACPGDVAAVRESPPTFGDDPAPGGYHRRRADDYDRALCLIPTDVVDFLLATQPRQWEKLEQHHGADVKPRFLTRLSREIARRGALDVLRNGVKDSGCKFRLAYRKDDRHVTHAALKTVAAFLNTEGGDLLIGVADDRTVLGIDHDRLESDDEFMRHLAQAVRNGLGDRAGTCVDPKTQIVEGKTVCLVSCQRSPEPVYLLWKGQEKAAEGDLYVRSGPGTVGLDAGMPASTSRHDSVPPQRPVEREQSPVLSPARPGRRPRPAI